MMLPWLLPLVVAAVAVAAASFSSASSVSASLLRRRRAVHMTTTMFEIGIETVRTMRKHHLTQ